MKRIKIFLKKYNNNSYLFSAFLIKPDSAESHAEFLEAAIEINEVNFVEDIIAPDYSVHTEDPESAESLSAAFSNLDIRKNREMPQERATMSLPDTSVPKIPRGKRTYPENWTDSENKA